MPELSLNQIICGDCVEVMKTFPDESIGLVVTSPPYNLKNSTGNGMKKGYKNGRWPDPALCKGYTNHHDCMPHKDYVKWQRSVLSEAMRVLKPDGAIFYNHKRRVQGGLEQNRNDILEGFPVRQTIIWDRGSGFNFNPGYFVPSCEDIYLITKPTFKLKPKANSLGTVWKFPPKANKLHPAPFPLELPLRCIRSSQFTGPVLDPFMGSGTTALAALQLNEDWIGIDNSKDYVQIATKQIENFSNI